VISLAKILGGCRLSAIAGPEVIPAGSRAKGELMRDDGLELEAGRRLRILKLDLHYGQNGVTAMDVQTAEFELQAETRRGT